MNLIEKSQKLKEVYYEIRGPILDEANRMADKGIDVIKLNIGNPYPFGFQAPRQLLDDLINNIEKAQGYSDSKGIFAAREAILEYYKGKNFSNLEIEHIFLGNGASEMIIFSMQALLNSGDEVLVPAPDYPLWTASVNLSGGKAVHYICDESAGWLPDLKDIRSKINLNTKAIVIINPNNPTGALYPKEILEGIIEIAREHNLIVFSDEIYENLAMDGLEYTSTASLASDIFVITMGGLSKSHCIAGFRSGWMVLSGKKNHARSYIEGLNTLASMRLCSNVPVQMVIPNALKGYQFSHDLVSPGGRLYTQRECICNELDKIPGISYVKPQAAFYIFPKLDKKLFNIHSDEKFALDFLKSKNVLVVQGSGFNWKDNDHFRIVFLADNPQLKEAMARLRDFLAGYKQA